MFGDDDEEDDEMTGETISTVSIRPESCGVLQFHNGTEEAMFIYIQQKAIQGDIENIIKAIDDFCYQRHWMMHIGDSKSRYLEDSVAKAQIQCTNASNHPIICVELGSYCGYSAIRIARLFNKNGLLICIENDIKCVNWTRRLVAYAKLDEKVIVLHGDVEKVIATGSLKQIMSNHHHDNCIDSKNVSISNNNNNNNDHSNNSNNNNNNNINSTDSNTAKESTLPTSFIDLLFIDHDKSKYRQDLEILIQHHFLTSGSIVVADNILSFNQPLNDYLEYVKNEKGPFASSITHHDVLEYSNTSTMNDSSRIKVSLTTASSCNSSHGNEKDENKRSKDNSDKDAAAANASFVDAVEISVFR